MTQFVDVIARPEMPQTLSAPPGGARALVCDQY